MNKKCGFLMPIFSLPTKYGIGSFGKWAYTFVDFIKNSGHSLWQILPMVQTGYCNSPYSTCCDISGNPYFIDLEILRSKKLLTYREVEAAIDKSAKIDYGKLYAERYPLLRKAFSRFDVTNKDFVAFVEKGEYRDYALFMAIKTVTSKPWYDWEAPLKYRDSEALNAFETENRNEVNFWLFLQFEFYNEYRALKKYANEKGIKIIGDLPLYISYDSVEVWSSPKDFLLDDGYKPTVVAGVPPDYFCTTGQLWGNPIYNYAEMRKNGYAFWKKRIAHALKLYDFVRIDHFRGIDRYWEIPAWADTAQNGSWKDGPKEELIALFPKDRVFAEDLGMIDQSVKDLLKQSGFPGMKVLSFAFDSDENNLYLPWNVEENSVMYTGTHDNAPLVAYFKGLSREAFLRQKVMIKRALEYLKIYKPLSGIYGTVEAICDMAYAAKSQITIIPIQDILLLDNDYRINTPGIAEGSWQVKIKESVFTKNLAEAMKRKAKRYSRS